MSRKPVRPRTPGERRVISGRRATSLTLAVLLLGSACTTSQPQTPPVATHGPAAAGGPGRRPANADQIATAARSDPAVGDPLLPELPVIEAEVTTYLRGEGNTLVRFHRSSEAMLVGAEDCMQVATRLESEGLSPPVLYAAASAVPDETISSAFVNDIAEKIRHVEDCSRTSQVSFTHTIVARILTTAGLL